MWKFNALLGGNVITFFEGPISSREREIFGDSCIKAGLAFLVNEKEKWYIVGEESSIRLAFARWRNLES